MIVSQNGQKNKAINKVVEDSNKNSIFTMQQGSQHWSNNLIDAQSDMNSITTQQYGMGHSSNVTMSSANMNTVSVMQSGM